MSTISLHVNEIENLCQVENLSFILALGQKL